MDFEYIIYLLKVQLFDQMNSYL